MEDLRDKLMRNKYNKRLKFIFGVLLLLATICIVVVWEVRKVDDYTAQPSNKSLRREDSYILEQDKIKDNRKVYSVSIDDTIEIFKDITIHQEEYASIFDNEELAYLQSLHENYGTVVSLFVFYKAGNFSLSDCTGKFKNEFKKNSEWLRFGFHSYDANTIYDIYCKRDISKDYNATVQELQRIVGKNCIDNVIRLASFQGTLKDIKVLQKNQIEPIFGVLTSDDKRVNYDLDNKNNEYIYCHDILKKDNFYYISTDLRVEFVNSVQEKINEFKDNSWNNQLSILTVFTHEWELSDENKKKLTKLCEYADQNHFKDEFLEDVLLYEE